MATTRTKLAAKRTPRAHRSSGRRLTIEQQQEYRSLAQFDERITEFGWLVNTKGRDHGEDLLVDIYDDGKSAGISFLAQLKSTDHLKGLVTKKDRKHAAYRLEVKDLKHWEVAAQLIVLFVWDVSENKGVWLPVPEVIKSLKGSAWRRQRTVTVKFPLSNGTGDAPLHRLRRLVADRNLPIVKRGKKFEVQSRMVFPKTPHGREAAAAFRAAVDYGEPAKIDGTFIKKWKMSSWWERLYGRAVPESITIGPSKDAVEVPVRLEIDTPGATLAVPLDLRRVKAGKKGFTLSNEHQRLPTRLVVVARREGEGVRLNLNVAVEHPVPDIFQTRDATDILLALRRGLRMRIVQRETGKLIVETQVPASLDGPTTASLDAWKPFLEKLCHVQSRIYKYGLIRIRNGRVSRRDARLAEEFYTICTQGFIERSVTFSAEFDLANGMWRDELLPCIRRGEPVEMRIESPNAGEIKILNVRVPLGPAHVRHDARLFSDQVEKALAEGHTSVKVTADLIAREEYPNWGPSTVPGTSGGTGSPTSAS